MTYKRIRFLGLTRKVTDIIHLGYSHTIIVECVYIHCYIYRITITQTSKNFLFVNSDFKEPLDLFY